MAADWSAEAAVAVERWAATQPGRGGDTRGWRRIGTVAQGPAGWLVLDARRDTRITSDRLDDVRLSDGRGPDQGRSHPVDEFRYDDGVFLLREPPGLPATLRHVWVRSFSTRFLLDKLAQGLRAAATVPLADALVRGALAGPPTAVVRAPGLIVGQSEALRACLSPGVRLVWGPPGTGKTRVLARAIDELVRRGKRVLLVSTANVAVVNALAEVVRTSTHRTGTAIRVGPAQLPEIAANPGVQLERLAGTQSVAVDEERGRVAARLHELDEVDSTIAALRAELGDYDDDSYLRAAARVDAGRTLVELEPRVAAARAAAAAAAPGPPGAWGAPRGAGAGPAAASAERVRSQAVEVLDEATTVRTSFAAVRRALRHAQEAADELLRLDRQQRILEIERDARAAREPPTGWLAGRRHRRELADASEAVDEFVEKHADRRAKLHAVQGNARTVAGAVTAEDLAGADAGLMSAQGAVHDARRRHEEAVRALDELRRATRAATAAGSPTDADRDLVARVVEKDLCGVHARVEDLEDRRRGTSRERGVLEERHRDLVDRSRKLRLDAEAQIVREARVVATTLARSRVHRALADARFDVVLVDEAGAATFAEVVLAVCRARTTAVLFGDFLQLGPVLDKQLKDDQDPAVKRWVNATCFSHVGIRTPQDALGHDSCTALLHQFRFGPQLRRLANDVIYDVLRDADELPGITARARTDIVVVDVSTVPDLADVRARAGGGKWWLAGVVLSRALVELHVPHGPVCVVAPYRVQADAVLQALEDRGVVTGAAAGTVHAFQGREYSTVVFDLVDDGRGWVAQGRADKGSFEAEGLRLFGVGITRARDRLYLLVDGRAVDHATTGSLGRLRQGLTRGEVRRWSAAALLGLDEPPAGSVDETFTEAARLVQQLVTVTDVHDERSFAPELERRLAAARRSVWMWSPWIANNARVVVPLIVAVCRRGVDVRVFLRPDHDRNMRSGWAQRQLPDLLASGATVIRSDQEHRKIVVVDRETVLLGSLNVLSNDPGRTREVMITMEGRAFAARLLDELRVEEIGTPRVCTDCGGQMEVRRRQARSAELLWQCRPCARRVPVPRPGSDRTEGATRFPHR